MSTLPGCACALPRGHPLMEILSLPFAASRHIYDAGVMYLGVSVRVKVGERTDKKADKTAVFRFKVGGTEAVAALDADLTSDSCTKAMPVAQVFGT